MAALGFKPRSVGLGPGAHSMMHHGGLLSPPEKQGGRQENDQRMFISYNVPGTLFLYVI